MRITWIGGPTTLLELGAFRIVFDPVFAGTVALGGIDSARAVPVPDVDTGDLDAVCVTALRPDHFDAASAARVAGSRLAICPTGAGSALEGAGFAAVRELAWYSETDVEKAGETLVVTSVPAESVAGDGNGYFLRHDAGGTTRTVYVTGDTVWSNDIRAIQAKLGYANLLVQYVGAERGAGGAPASPGGKDAMQFVYRMQPNAIVPVHHHTFAHYTEPVGVFAEHLARTIYDRRLHVLAEGESWEK